LIYHRSPWADPNPEECKSFATFQLDKAGFLMERFSTMPKNVAQFFASRVFCRIEEDRISIKEWRNWCDKFVERMLDEETELDDVFDDVQELTLLSSSNSRESSSSVTQKQHGHDRHQSWSDVVGEFESETDFNNTLSKHSRSSSTNIKKVAVKRQDNETKFTEKDDNDENQVESANNSDADSGFEEEEVNGNINKKLKERGGKFIGNPNPSKVLSVSPPKVIYCKPKPWGDYRSRGHQRENSIEVGSTISNVTNNNHWSSYNQRRERLEQRRKEKQEQTLNSLGAYRRRGSLNADTSDTLMPGRPFDLTPRRRPQRPSNSGQESIYTVPPRRNIPRSPPRRKSSQAINNNLSSPETSVASFQFPSTSPNYTKTITNSNTPNQSSLRSFDKAPKKVGKSTKNHLGKMLAGVVMFNRGVKVGGQVINEQE
jgi:hypothetical protein